MTREEIVEGLKLLEDNMVHFDELQNDKGEWIDVHELLFEAIQALSQEPSRDIKEIAEIMKCDADAETKCKMISNILTAKPHYFEKQEPCDDCIFKNEWNKIGKLLSNILEKHSQKSGKWQRVSIEKYIQHAMAYCVCSECGGQTIGEPKYCPNCGCRMAESEG